MTEQNRQSLQNFLAEEAENQNRLKQSQEQVRQELENRVRQAIKKYQQEFEELTSVAKEKTGNMVQPWFNDLVQDGTYNQLLEYLKTHNGRGLSVSDSILYYWPNKAFQEFRYSQEMRQEPFQGYANYIVKNYKDYQEGIEKHQAGVDEVWSARFHIGRQRGLQISQWPIIGGGYGFAVGRTRDLKIPVDIKNISAKIPSIHPEVWIGFADQIENGTALQVLQESLITKPIRVVEAGSAEWERDLRQAEVRRAEYLRTKSARTR